MTIYLFIVGNENSLKKYVDVEILKYLLKNASQIDVSKVKRPNNYSILNDIDMNVKEIEIEKKLMKEYLKFHPILGIHMQLMEEVYLTSLKM